MLVQLRRRTWRVEGIAGGVMTATPIDDFGEGARSFLLGVEAVSPGTHPPPRLENLGDNRLQELYLQAQRLDTLHGAAPFLSIQRTAVIPVEYQLVPLVMALRQNPVRMLIADTIGLGKTIEAGLIASELLARGMARSVLIITPASLREQWQDQMRDLFYLDFEIVSGETRRRLERSIPPGADPWLYFDRLIISIDYAKDLRIRPEIRKRLWDLVIVDECHNAAMPHSQMGRKADMDRWEAVSQIAASSAKHLVMLSATPHNGYTDSYCSLLGMISPDLVSVANGQPVPARERARRHVCQRSRKDVRQWFGEAGLTYPFPEREPPEDTEVAVDLHRDYYRLLQRLDDVLKLVAVHAQRAGRSQPAEWLRLHLHRRALSSPEALRRSLENRIARLKTMVPDSAQPDGDNPLLMSLGDRGASDVETEEQHDRGADTSLLAIEHRLQLEHFSALLDELRKIRATKDRKLATLRDQVIPELLAKETERSPARVIVFTRYTDTLGYWERELRRQPDYEVFTLLGDLSQAERDARLARFSASKRAVMLATDVISEGLNLQTACCMVVHGDIPYNPNRMEQRTGRVDRFGQRSPTVYVRTLYCRDTTDEDVLEIVVRKLDRIRRDLGFSPPIPAGEETVLRALTRRRQIREEQLGPSLPGLFDEIEDDLVDAAAIARMQSEGFYGQADVRISDVSERLREVHRRFGSPERIHEFIRTGLTRFGCAVEHRPDGALSIAIKDPRLQIAGLPVHLPKVVFDPAQKELHPDALVLDVGHPLLRRLNAVIREVAFRSGDEQGRTSARYVAGQRGTLLIGHALLRATSKTTPPVLLEEMVTLGMRAGLSGHRPLSADEVAESLARPVSARPIDRWMAIETIQKLAARPEWADAQTAAADHAMSNLRIARERMKTELDVPESQGNSWLEGFADIEQVSLDLLCVTLLLPEGA